MLSDLRLSLVAELIRDHILLDGIDRYCQETGVKSSDFIPFEPIEFGGDILAADGSNVSVCGWSVAAINLIRSGYVVYQGQRWKRTVITFDDIFFADPAIYADQFAPPLKRLGQDQIDLKEEDLERLSTYFRELQEYASLNDAISVAKPGDIILYDGSFDVFEPLRAALSSVFRRAEERGVALLAVAKSSSLYWGEGISLPFMYHTNQAGSMLLPNSPWYLNLKDKRVNRGPGKWGGESFIVRFTGRSDHAFRVDVPGYLAGQVEEALAGISSCSTSAECPGYPHALFRAHRDIKITDNEGASVRMRLKDKLYRDGLSPRQIAVLMQDYHDILEMRQGI
ncbi:MAG TPA: DNA double-strand break repair nuclease NurA [Methanothrix sp.]|jgi:hypothetical protein|uniref:DNA double-strand break repair nuclease NurA n=1 Tax=Methanothrix sp. TaxID=90426 RepID=UPI002CB6A14E|nr:DNA double-strand break repair nuclease NurA [Methanothrix sp.]MDI9417449.1 DNA double-strand break repair nuclease NurA [Euryarchaeota archaeon]HON35603.1 DNA double-strand break repair nuclease NurA [Methanothrix sp.]HRU74738.1 DNA double-strand break repair nuclease NurA [Methanothrix sp.]